MDVVNSSINALNALAGKIAPAVTTAVAQTSPVIEGKGGCTVRDHPYERTKPTVKKACTVADDGDAIASLKQVVQQHAAAAVVLQQQQQQQHQAAVVAAAVLQQQAAAAAAVSAAAAAACSTSPPSNNNQQQQTSCNGNDDVSSLIR